MFIDKAKPSDIKSAGPNKQQKNKPRQQKKIPKKITETYLHNAGLYYLQRYAASSGHFRTIMLRKVRRSCMHHKDQDFEECAALVDKLVEKFHASMLLDDDSYIRAMVSSLRRKGLSSKAVLQKMQVKGVPSEQTKKYLEQHDKEFCEPSENPDLKAAIIFARKKRLGPFAKEEAPEPQKILAKFARAGFSFDISRHVMNMGLQDAEDLLF